MSEGKKKRWGEENCSVREKKPHPGWRIEGNKRPDGILKGFPYYCLGEKEREGGGQNGRAITTKRERAAIRERGSRIEKEAG